jgi:hypothetical protein
MGAFAGSGRNAASASGAHPHVVASLVTLAALPAVLIFALWKGGVSVSSDGALAKKLGGKARRRGTSAREPKPKTPPTGAPAVVIVDPYSSGGVLARLAYDEGYLVVRVLSCSSQRMADQSLPAACKGLPFAATVVVRSAFLMIMPFFPTHPLTSPSIPANHNHHNRSLQRAGPTPCSPSCGRWGSPWPASSAAPSRAWSSSTR